MGGFKEKERKGMRRRWRGGFFKAQKGGTGSKKDTREVYSKKKKQELHTKGMLKERDSEKKKGTGRDREVQKGREVKKMR